MSEAITIELPWPDRGLSPNARSRTWHKKHRLSKAARKAGYEYALAAGAHLIKWNGPIALHWTFHCKGNHGNDDDNLEASMKPYRDGIANAMGVDDNCFTATRSFGENIKGGKVILTITEIGEGA